MHDDDYKDWRKNQVEKTWGNFKSFFIKANQHSRESRSTSRGAGYQANHTVQDSEDPATEVQALEAIANLAVSTAEGCVTIENLTKIIDTLTTTNAQLVKTNTQLVKEIAACKRTTTRTSYHYCWSCGIYCNYLNHHCAKKKEGHQASTTYSNKMGGNEKKHANV